MLTDELMLWIYSLGVCLSLSWALYRITYWTKKGGDRSDLLTAIAFIFVALFSFVLAVRNFHHVISSEQAIFWFRIAYVGFIASMLVGSIDHLYTRWRIRTE
jgi:hypothetical protein